LSNGIIILERERGCSRVYGKEKLKINQTRTKVHTSTHHRISTDGFTIPVTSPDKSVVNFSRS
jgi:hypothetical protein